MRKMPSAVVPFWPTLVVFSQWLAVELSSSGPRRQLHDLVRAVYRLPDAAPAPDDELLPVVPLVYVQSPSFAQVFVEPPSRPIT